MIRADARMLSRAVVPPAAPMRGARAAMYALRSLFALVFVWMTWTIVSTSLESNLFSEWSALAAIPWMRATLWDFYAILLPFVVWLWYRERSLALRILWTIGFVGLGSVATSAYMLVRLFSVDARTATLDSVFRKGG